MAGGVEKKNDTVNVYKSIFIKDKVTRIQLCGRYDGSVTGRKCLPLHLDQNNYSTMATA